MLAKFEIWPLNTPLPLMGTLFLLSRRNVKIWQDPLPLVDNYNTDDVETTMTENEDKSVMMQLFYHFISC